jgi:hypothetical protein
MSNEQFQGEGLIKTPDFRLTIKTTEPPSRKIGGGRAFTDTSKRFSLLRHDPGQRDNLLKKINIPQGDKFHTSRQAAQLSLI